MNCKAGDRIEGFRLLRKCGTGAYGTVFLAESLVTGRRFALKIISGNDRFSRRELQGITQYMRICPQSPLMQIYYAGEYQDSFYYVMDPADNLNGESAEYLPDTLENRMKRQGRVDPEALLRIAREIEERLRFLHGKGLLHRDIKPGNILFINGEAVPGDIGLLTGQPGSTLAGTPGFLSPDAAAGLRPFAPQDDFYSLGKTLYCALTGFPPEKYPAFPPDLSLKKCAPVITLYNAWCAGKCAPVPPGKSRWKNWIRAGILLSMAAAAAAAGILFYPGRTPGTGPTPPTHSENTLKKNDFCSVREALESAETLLAGHVPPPGFAELRPRLEEERDRLMRLRFQQEVAACKLPVSPEDRERAARDPAAASHPEFYVRVKRRDDARAAFDREHENDPVLVYFKTLDWIGGELSTLRALAQAAPQLAMTDFSEHRTLFSEACERLSKLEKQLMLLYAPDAVTKK